MSELMRTRREIELAMESAALALNGLRQTASHKIIHHHYEVLDTRQKNLRAIISEEAAAAILYDICEHVID